MCTTFRAAPLAEATWRDFETLAALPGSTIMGQCWCVAYRCVGVDTTAAGASDNRKTLRRLVDWAAHSA